MFFETYDIRMDVQSELYHVTCCYCIQVILLVYVYISQELFLVYTIKCQKHVRHQHGCRSQNVYIKNEPYALYDIFFPAHAQ